MATAASRVEGLLRLATSWRAAVPRGLVVAATISTTVSATVSATATADGATSAVSSDTGAAAVDYDRIISFLGILKETSA